MQVLDINIPANRRQPVRLDGQDGPWSVSVAETPHDSRSYSLYIKTPTHNLTLTRTAIEILDLDRKLRDSHPNSKIPIAPIDASTLPIPPKRKSTFLNTLSRLASPTSNKSAKSAAARRENATVVASTLPTPPLTSPASESTDPFTSVENPTIPPSSPSATSTAIAAYLTTISNASDLRKDRVWKRFVRVRMDDLESVRVERAIKRVRSDLAAHTGGLPNNRASVIGSVNGGVGGEVHARDGDVTVNNPERSLPSPQDEVPSGNDQDPTIANQQVDGDSEHHEREATATPADALRNADSGTAKLNGEVHAASVDQQSVEEEVKGATGTDESVMAAQGHVAVDQVHSPTDSYAVAARLPRSQSCEPNKSHRMIRPYASSDGDVQDGGLSSQFETGDESSFSATAPRRRKKKQGKKSTRKVTIDDFEMIRVLGKGCAGKVLLVKHKTGNSGLFALKAITKRHVLAHQELQHTLTEQAVLKRMAAESKDPFVVKLWWSFHDKENLFLVMDFHPGGDLATQLARWGRLSRDRTRFYAAEIVEGVEGLHAAGVIYRDLKPENILIAADGHIVLTDFGLSKEFERPHVAHSYSSNINSSSSSPSSSAPLTPNGSKSNDFYSSAPGTPQSVMPPWMKPDKNGEMIYGWPGQPIGNPDVTTTFCGTAEYLAPEVIQGLPYGYEVDWWSFGTMLFEMLTGMTPFYANNHSDMYVRVLQDELQFPDDRVMDQDTKSLIRGLLQKNPDLRIREPRIKKHPYFSMIDWCHVYYKRYIPPYVPPVDRTVAYDTQNFDETFLDMEPVLDEYVDEGGQATDTDAEPQTDTDRTDGESNTTPSQSRSSSVRPLVHTPVEDDESVDLFDGYSFKGRHSIIMDDDEEAEDGDSEEGDEESLTGDSKSSVLTGDSTKTESETVEEEDERREEEDAISEMEPKTPEARPSALPLVDTTVEPVPQRQPSPPRVTQLQEQPQRTQQQPRPKSLELAIAKDAPSHSEDDLVANVSAAAELEVQLETQAKEEEANKRLTFVAEVKEKPVNGRHTPPPKTGGSRLFGRKPRREKSGVPALDKYLSDGGDDEPEMTEPERDEEDEDWDFVEAGDGEDRNGAKGTSLWARGVVDRYKLSVFRKGSTPGNSSGAPPSAGRSFSGVSKASDIGEVAESPSPSQRRGRTSGLNFRKHPRQFLRPKSPPSSFSNSTTRSFSATANTLSAASSSTATGGGLLTPVNATSSLFSPSLRSKPSAVSMDGRSMSSDYSGNVISPSTPSAANGGPEAPPSSEGAELSEKPGKTKKLKRYKNNAEKVFSLFSSNSSPKPAS